MSFDIEKEEDLADFGIAMWKAERPDLDTSGKEITGRLLRLGAMVDTRMNTVTAAFGIKYSIYAIIATLRVSGAPYQLTPKTLQERLLVSSGGLSNLIGRIEDLGYVRRISDPADGRGVLVELTEKGLDLAEEAMVAQSEAEVQFIRMLSDDERKTLKHLLRKIIVVNSIRN